jgi:hypothetical protein
MILWKAWTISTTRFAVTYCDTLGTYNGGIHIRRSPPMTQLRLVYSKNNARLTGSGRESEKSPQNSWNSRKTTLDQKIEFLRSRRPKLAAAIEQLVDNATRRCG